MADGTRGLRNLSFEREGAALLPGLAAPHLDKLSVLFPRAGEAAGVRLNGFGAASDLFGQTGTFGGAVARLLGENARPVRAIAFDKSDARNWALGWHQDRTVCVAERIDTEGFGPWSIKQDMVHVEPPFPLLESMVTMRIHLDPVDARNAPLKIALGSHRYGKIEEGEIATVVKTSDTYQCLSEAGDVWLYATPILHASDRAGPGRRRRVLQVDYCAMELPTPLRWAFGENSTSRT